MKPRHFIPFALALSLATPVAVAGNGETSSPAQAEKAEIAPQNEAVSTDGIWDTVRSAVEKARAEGTSLVSDDKRQTLYAHLMAAAKERQSDHVAAPATDRSSR